VLWGGTSHATTSSKYDAAAWAPQAAAAAAAAAWAPDARYLGGAFNAPPAAHYGAAAVPAPGGGVTLGGGEVRDRLYMSISIYRHI
jgi:hypothetical protein